MRPQERALFFFSEFLQKLGLAPDEVRLLRHDARGEAAWRRGGATAFGCFASFQKRRPSPFLGVTLACHFLPGPTLPNGNASALFLGITRILDQWRWDETRLPVLQDEDVLKTEEGREDIDAFDLVWLEEGADYCERLLVQWGTPASTRAWSQWANRGEKQIVELRLSPQEDPFPGFANLNARIRDLPRWPIAWVTALEAVRGVYLLVADTGEQYVGSAAGLDGFMGRWRQYAANGHGGNVLLRARGHEDYAVSILEVASPDMSQSDIIARESFWKLKLGARAHGLNAN